MLAGEKMLTTVAREVGYVWLKKGCLNGFDWSVLTEKESDLSSGCTI